MADIHSNTQIAPSVFRLIVRAPEIARSRRAGQFIILRARQGGERIPLTIADTDGDTITLVYQVVGKSTAILSRLAPGGEIPDLAGPLGKPTHLERYGNVVCIGGGIGIAPIHPIAQALKQAGNKVTAILGARSAELVIMDEEMRRASDTLLFVTDDGSRGEKGLVTQPLRRLCKGSPKPNLVVAIGPAIMMKAVAELTKPFGVPTLVSLNTVMIDGTGMCGGCRVTVGGETKFVCVDGPEFDGHLVDFDEMMRRQRMYVREEREAYKAYLIERELAESAFV
jgi:ferredoxin/flavodoxin---NADP+ reductase